MKFTLFTALFMAAISFVYGQSDLGIFTTVPTTNQVVNSGSFLNITWTFTNPFTASTDPNVTLINTIELRKGDPANLELVLPNILNTSISALDLVYTWDIPSNLTTNSTYALIYMGYNGIRSYSSFFTIQQTNITATTAAVINTGATTTAASVETTTA
ncbi:hypothetical protein K501DRAFT_338333 [Backusella circina FSU 941]|nr:hypothetical protein K501DRAFT_338333 [Backusella circina FSU 941]